MCTVGNDEKHKAKLIIVISEIKCLLLCNWTLWLYWQMRFGLNDYATNWGYQSISPWPSQHLNFGPKEYFYLEFWTTICCQLCFIWVGMSIIFSSVVHYIVKQENYVTSCVPMFVTLSIHSVELKFQNYDKYEVCQQNSKG